MTMTPQIEDELPKMEVRDSAIEFVGYETIDGKVFASFRAETKDK